MSIPSITPDTIEQPDTVQNVAEQKSWKNSPVVLVILLIVIVATVGFTVYAYTTGFSLQSYLNPQGDLATDNTKTATNTDTKTDTQTDTKPTSTPKTEELKATPLPIAVVKGKYVTATMYKGWSITEDDKDTASTKGLTSIKILDNSKVVIASIDAIAEKGGMDFCQSIAKFADTDAAYITAESKKTKTASSADIVVSEFSLTPYVSYKILGNSIRRIGDVIYFNRGDNAKYFHDACSDTDVLNRKWGTLSFTNTFNGESKTDTAYMLSVYEENLNLDNLGGLDLALSTLKTNK